MTIPEIFDQLVSSPELQITITVSDRKAMQDIKRGLSNYKLRNKERYEDILGPFRLRYNIISGPEQELKMRISIEGNDTSKDYEVEIHG